MKSFEPLKVMAALASGAVLTQSYQKAHEYIKTVHDTHKYPKSKIGLFVGASGVGKTKALLSYASKFPNIEHNTLSEKPVIYLKLLGGCSVGAFYSQMYTALTNMDLPKCSNSEALKKIIYLAKKLKVQLFIIDEAQHVLPNYQSAISTVTTYADGFKTLVDDTGTAVLLSGMPSLTGLLTLNGNKSEKSKQLANRALPTHLFGKLCPFEMQNLLIALQGRLKSLDVSINLTTPDMVKRFCIISQGLILVVIDTIQFAINQAGPDIKLNALSKAFETSCSLDHINAFKLKTEQLDNLFEAFVSSLEKYNLESINE